jgi:DNA-binding LytR/AlgR family response regulator
MIVLSPNDSIATFSYKIGAFHFLKSRISPIQLNLLKYKMLTYEEKKNGEAIIFKSKNNGIQVTPVKDIACFNGKGDYCDFRFLDGSSYLDTRRIGEILSKINWHPYLFKLNKSVVININKVSKISGNIVFFTNSIVKLHLSPNAISEVKKRLLWLYE